LIILNVFLDAKQSLSTGTIHSAYAASVLTVHLLAVARLPMYNKGVCVCVLRAPDSE